MPASYWSKFRRLVGNGRDQLIFGIAEQREAAETALRLSERQFRIFVESVADYAIYMLDTAGRIVTWNRGAERIKGYVAEEIIGQNFSSFYTADDRRKEIPQRALETAVREGQFYSEGWLVRKDGSQFSADTVIQAIREH